MVGSFAAVALIAAIVPAAVGEFSPPAANVGNPGSGTAYVWKSAGNRESVIPVRLSTGAKLTPLTFPGDIQAVEAAPDGKAVYVFSVRRSSSTAQPQTGVGYVTAINNATGEAGHPIRLTGGIDTVYDILTVQVAPNGKLAVCRGKRPRQWRDAGGHHQPSNRRPAAHRNASLRQQRAHLRLGDRS